MIVPSIDIRRGSTVQLVGGERQALDAGDPRPLARRFGRVGEVAVIDLDAAMGTGSNAETIAELLDLARCRVGGGIRSAAAARTWLDRGAEKVILGTAAVPPVLRALPRERVIAALDAVHGEVVVEGWKRRTGQTVVERMEALRGLCGGFLVTFVEREGRMEGLDLEAVRRLRDAAGDASLTVAGGVRSAEEVAELDAMGVDVQVGMALYTGVLDLAEAFAAPLRSDRPDGLWPTVVVDERGVALGLAWSSLDSVREALETGRGVYQSRSRGLWVKGETSGNTQELVRIDVDCDRDALRFVVRQHGDGFCHRGSWTCFGPAEGLSALEQIVAQRASHAEPGSYTRRLLDDPALLRAKLLEEAAELADARGVEHAEWEAADLLYFLVVALHGHGGRLAGAERELDRRRRRVTRRSETEGTG